MDHVNLVFQIVFGFVWNQIEENSFQTLIPLYIDKTSALLFQFKYLLFLLLLIHCVFFHTLFISTVRLLFLLQCIPITPFSNPL